MPAEIIDQQEMEEFVRTHLGHRLSAMVAPICRPDIDNPCCLWKGRNDSYRAAQEGSYVMLRLFVEFLGVKSDRSDPPNLICDCGALKDDLRLSSFRKWGVANLWPKDFDSNQAFIAKIHRTLCKINAHFTYAADDKLLANYNRVASLESKDWQIAVEIILQKLDESFYRKVNQPITVHIDLVAAFDAQFVKKLNLKSDVKGDGLGPPS